MESATDTKSAFASPWIQLIIGVICMAMIANLQYGWTLFVGPIDAKYHWGRASIQVAFTIFVLLETWLVPVEGYLVDRFGPRWIVVVGGLLCGIAWAINSIAESLPTLYFAAAVAGLGAGAVYGTCIGNAVKWFPGRRGLAAGLTAAGFGAGSALTIIPIANMIKSAGYEQTFLTFGLGALVVLAWVTVTVLGRLNEQSLRRQRRRRERPLHIEPVMPAKGAHELAVDEGRDPGVLGPWAEIVGRDQAIDDGIHRRSFSRREEQIAAGTDRCDRIGFVRTPRQYLGDHPRRCAARRGARRHAADTRFGRARSTRGRAGRSSCGRATDATARPAKRPATTGIMANR